MKGIGHGTTALAQGTSGPAARQAFALRRPGQGQRRSLLENHYDTLRGTVQELLGHKNVKTTMIYTHARIERSESILNRGGLAVRSPLD